MHNTLIFITVLILSSIGHLATDIYLPSMPTMTDYFATSNTLVQFTFSAYMLSFCLTPLFVGPLSDKIGRKRPIVIGILISLVATFLCIFTQNIYLLIFARFLQGIGLGTVVTVSRAIIPDYFQGKEMAKYYSLLAMFMPVVLSMGPLLGAYIQEHSSWQGVFVFMVCYLIIILLLTYSFFKDKVKVPHIPNAELKKVFHIYKDLMLNIKFLSFSLCSIFLFTGISVYLTVSSFLFQDRLGLTPLASSATFLIIFAAVFIMGFLNVKLLSKFKPKKILFLVNPFILASGIFLIFFDLTGSINIYTLVFSLTLYFCALPGTFANSTTLMMGSIQGNFGAALALLSCLQFLGAAIGSALISFTDPNSVIPLGVTFIMVAFGCLSMLLLEGKTSNRQQEATSFKSI